MIPPKSELDKPLQGRPASSPVSGKPSATAKPSVTEQQGKDQDRGKGAVEQDEQNEGGNMSMEGQLGHRDQDPMVKSADSDFPEPGGNPEHSGEHETKKK